MLLSDHQDVPGLQALLSALTGGSFVVAGLIARTRRPLNRTGLLLIAVGLAWFVTTGLQGSNDSFAWTIGIALIAVPAGFLMHLLLAYPSGRLQSRWERAVVATGYGLVIVGNVVHLPVEPDPMSCAECPYNAFLVSDRETVATIVTVSVSVVAVALLLAVVATLVRRWRASSPAARRTLTPVFLAGGTTLLLFAVSVGTYSFWTQNPCRDPLRRASGRGCARVRAVLAGHGFLAVSETRASMVGVGVAVRGLARASRSVA